MIFNSIAQCELIKHEVSNIEEIAVSIFHKVRDWRKCLLFVDKGITIVEGEPIRVYVKKCLFSGNVMCKYHMKLREAVMKNCGYKLIPVACKTPGYTKIWNFNFEGDFLKKIFRKYECFYTLEKFKK